MAGLDRKTDGGPGARGSLRFDRNEVAGALGDLGTFIPLLLGMVKSCGLQIVPALFFAGVMNIASGILFRIPMPVQPMKAIAAVAIAEGLNESQILAAGMVTGFAILLLSLSGLIDFLNRVVPKSVVRGLQLALGLKLAIKGGGLIVGTGVFFGADSVGLGVFCSVLVGVVYFSKRFPGALLIFSIGLVALLFDQPELIKTGAVGVRGLGFSWSLPDLTNSHDWIEGLWRGALPQLPLTTLNSVIAVCALSCDLFPNHGASPRRVAISVALMNLLACPFGAMPMCHGAGGLAAQYRFGARTGGSVVFLGVLKCVLAIVFGGSLVVWLAAYPQSVLGVLLAFSGIELGRVCRDQKRMGDFLAMIVTSGACLATNTAIGFVVGWIAAWVVVLITLKKKSSDSSV